MIRLRYVTRLLTTAAGLLLLAGLYAAAQDTSTVQGQTEYLQKLQQILPSDPPFDKWLEKTHALPPDFSKFPKQNEIPDPLTFLDGRKVKTPADWAARRKEIDELSQKYVWGTFPPKPKISRVDVLNETHGKGYITRNLHLIFGPGDKGSISVRVIIPDGKGTFPVLINTDLMGWAPELIRRGYISAGYNVDDSDGIAALYPQYDFGDRPRHAWLASLVVDYLETLPQVDTKHIAIWGASLNGKVATIAGVLDTRLAAVIASTTGVGGVLSWRDSGEVGIGEGIETTTRRYPTWFASQLRFFTGREDRLPVDGNLVAAMIAPRSLLMTWGHNDQVANTWGNEDTYYSALKVYKLLGVPDRVGTMRVPGFHGAQDEQADLDWLDIQFGRSTATYTSNLIFQWDWNKWRQETHQSVELGKFPVHKGDDLAAVHSTADWDAKSSELRKSINWMLGEAPPKMTDEEIMAGRRRFPQPPPGTPNPGQVTPDIPAWAMQFALTATSGYGWPSPQKDHYDTRRITFAGNLTGDLYYPKGTPAGTKLPTVIWLHGYSYQLGYMWGYHGEDLHPILALVEAGYAVLAYDQSGFGSRLTETGPFYDRYPQWSHMGRLIDDAESAIDMLQKNELVDPQRIYLYGYSLGGAVAIYTAALDSRVKGIVAVAGFTPMRTDTAATGTGGIARFSKTRDILPRLGFFVGHESQLPYDYDDLLAMIAPRQAMIVEPQLDREATPADVHQAVEDARKIYDLYGADKNLNLSEPWDFNRLTNKMLDESIHWLKTNGK